MENRFSLATILGADAKRYIEMIDSLGLTSKRTKYSFVSNDDFDKLTRNNPVQSMQIYWGEILGRAHLTAVTAILRSRRWVSGIVTAAKEKNLLAFAATLRGLIESAADASTALTSVPATLARHHAQIMSALSGTLRGQLPLAEELEDELIHFAYARHLRKSETGNVPVTHRARQTRKYIEILEKGKVSNVLECYRDMCDLTHPGASSVWMWLLPLEEFQIELAPDQEEAIIARLLTDYQKMLTELLMFGFNPAVVTLKVLNYFPLEHLHMPELMSWDLSGIPIWQKCFRDLKSIQPQTRFH